MKQARRRKLFAAGVCAAALSVAAVSGTMAYLQDTDSDVNVMTMGNVDIEQREYERVFNEEGEVIGMQPFTQGQALLPIVVTNGSGNEVWAPNPGVDLYYGDYIEGAVGGNGTWLNMNNEMDKFVFVENTGKTDAYYRTIIAYEAETSVTMKNDYNQGMIHVNVNNNERFTWAEAPIPDVEIDGVKYNIWSVVYRDALEPGEISRPSLLQVGMDQIATNEYVAQFGDTYDILVLSQAVQTEGFSDAATALNEAFGEVSAATAAAWFEGVEVPELVDSADALVEALEAGESVALTADIDMKGKKVEILEGENAMIDLNGHTLTSKDGGQGNNMAIKVSQGATLTLEDSAGGGEIVSSCYGVYVQPNATFVMNGGTIEVSGNGVYDMGVVVWNGEFVMNEGAIDAQWSVWTSNYWKNDGVECGVCKVTIDDDCTLTSKVVDIDVAEASDTVLNVPDTVTVNYEAE